MVHLGTKGIDKQLGFKIFVAHNPNFSQIKQQDKELNPWVRYLDSWVNL